MTVEDHIRRARALGLVVTEGPAPRLPVAPPAPGDDEAAFTARVVAAAHAAGWLVAHFAPARVVRKGVEKYETPARVDGRGFPDLVLARAGEVRLAELKTDAGRLTADQERWVRESGAAVWRPAAWELIVATLGG